jgi:hypothetical protein
MSGPNCSISRSIRYCADRPHFSQRMRSMCNCAAASPRENEPCGILQPTFDPQGAFHLRGRVADVRSLPGGRGGQCQLRRIVPYWPALSPWPQMTDESRCVFQCRQLNARTSGRFDRPRQLARKIRLARFWHATILSPEIANQNNPCRLGYRFV